MIARRLQCLQHFQQTVGHIEIICADIVATGRMVVVDNGDPFIDVALVLQRQPTLYPPQLPGQLSAHHFAATQLGTGGRVDTGV